MEMIDGKPSSGKGLTEGELERRRSRLRHLPGHILAVYEGEAVEILDVSLTGLGFETTRDVDAEGLHRLDLCTEVGELTLVGKLAWCREAGTVERDGRTLSQRRVGIRFTPLPREDAVILQRLLEHRAREDGGDVPREEFTTEFDEGEVTEKLRSQERKP